jgi:hypothetical protein
VYGDVMHCNMMYSIIIMCGNEAIYGVDSDNKLSVSKGIAGVLRMKGSTHCKRCHASLSSFILSTVR